MSETTQDFSELAIPEEPGVYWCWRHRKVKTRLRCGRCEKPICPKCTVMGPTGSRCRECASNRSQHIYKVSPPHLLMTFAASLVLGAIGVALLRMMGFFVLFFAPMIGTLLGKAIIAITRGKRGPVLATIASLGATLGAILPFALSLLAVAGSPVPGAFAATMTYMLPQLGFALIFLAFVIPAIWYWIK